MQRNHQTPKLQERLQQPRAQPQQGPALLLLLMQGTHWLQNQAPSHQQQTQQQTQQQQQGQGRRVA
jgi:hypothetical protein